MPILPGRHRKARTSSRMDSLWNRNYIRILSANFLAYLSFMLIVPLLPLYLNETFGADKQTIGIALAGYTVMALLARPFSGYIVDTFPRKTVLLICNFLFMGLFLGYVAAGSLTLFAIFRTLHGAPFGSYTVAASTVAIDVLPSSRRTEGIGSHFMGCRCRTWSASRRCVCPVCRLSQCLLGSCGGQCGGRCMVFHPCAQTF